MVGVVDVVVFVVVDVVSGVVFSVEVLCVVVEWVV